MTYDIAPPRAANSDGPTRSGLLIARSAGEPTLGRTRVRNMPFLIALVALGVAACGEEAEELAARPSGSENTNTAPAGNSTLGTGASGLFIGQSFFVPVAQAFDASVGRGDFPDHSIDTVFAGGANGSPQALWENEERRSEIEGKLATGEVELFGMTIGELNPENPAEFYARWVDLALSYNPATKIFIGFPYLQGGPSKATEAYDREITEGGDNFYPIVEGLREVSPDTEFFYFNYGKVLSQMKSELDAGELEDIDALAPERGASNQGDAVSYLFSDGGVGHAGSMAEHVCSLVWANMLYGADISALIDPRYDGDDAVRIASDVILFNGRYSAP